MSLHPEAHRHARLVDEEPTPGETAHLAACERCSAELDALRGQTEALTALPDIQPSPGAWGSLAARLEAEGLLDDAAPVGPSGRGPAHDEGRHRPAAVWLARRGESTPGAGWRAAAAVALLVVGAAAGAWIGGALQEGAEPAGAIAGISGTGAVPATLAVSPDEAARAVQLAEAAYLAALARYLEVAEPEELPDPVARLATLESIIVTTRAALHEAPSDPVINGYHLTAVAQRDATLAQLASLVDEPWF